MTTPLNALAAQGQSLWLDYIRCDLFDDGGLDYLINVDGIKGLTSNPAIFEKAIAGSTLYDASIEGGLRQGLRDPEQLVEKLAIQDIRQAADLFWPVYQATGGVDGYVSLEVSPAHANNTARTIDEGLRLWREVGRLNLMIKVPGTPAGVPAVRALIAEGVNVNVTLLFSRKACAAVADAFVEGLELRLQKGEPIDQMASVASFFISRIDTAIEQALTKVVGDASALQGRVAVANAKLAYQDFLARLQTPRWQALAAHGAKPQRLLWASTSTKNPAFRDTLYIDQLIGPMTVNTVPPATLEAFMNHGVVARTLDAEVAFAQQVMSEVERLEIPFEAIAEQLATDGVQLFAQSWSQLLNAVAVKRDRELRADGE